MIKTYAPFIVFLAIGLTIAFGKLPPQPFQPQTKSATTTRLPPPASSSAFISAVEATPTPTPIPTPAPTPQPTTAPPPDSADYYPISGGITGKVSYYSRAGCIGCSANLITASGEPLDDNALTLAVTPGAFPMGTMVLVTNLSSHRQVIAKVNDTGGFAQYNRVADLSLALYTYLNAKTDESIILIQPVAK
jgi:rare lipoprotein A (peptidoglycan hydrolase)